ncbi:hypothetical protein UFOVP1491_97 [uncultured Caudovirales phage]|uniref:Uncharacterized protein n=1 Tax=uncultured Caudovirales phage TaxID=2100421 RepID=A0A6J5MF59_9CAUD|nr:hypothetical protein UFOVP485_24 [uncultured Caudovirales phage]CAB4151069.1 hypothetical protein UFOVP575_128 [uncultured Caudovirales phage]CAB4174216.1 hypothetical protein UFOVP963_32 [uncultured Caudovirales phage]CAB4179786.1 hypothetical protein UFOVP1032_97 [uncultured Caudovirales phage]CAB4185288.1 hypothetical protein UFOVP1125_13 [uncultured Caudovirales phage]
MLGKSIKTLFYAGAITQNTSYINNFVPSYSDYNILRRGMTVSALTGSTGAVGSGAKIIDITTDGRILLDKVHTTSGTLWFTVSDTDNKNIFTDTTQPTYLKAKVICEWNANDFSEPYFTGTGTGSAKLLTKTYSGGASAGTWQIKDSTRWTGVVWSTGKLNTANNKAPLTLTTEKPAYITQYILTSADQGSDGIYKNAFRFQTWLKSTLGSETVNVKIIGYKTDGSTTGDLYASHSYEINDSVETFIELDCFGSNPSAVYNTAKLEISIYRDPKVIETTIIEGGSPTSDTRSIEFTIDEPQLYVISHHEAESKDLFPVKSVFLPNRPGDSFCGEHQYSGLGNGLNEYYGSIGYDQNIAPGGNPNGIGGAKPNKSVSPARALFSAGTVNNYNNHERPYFPAKDSNYKYYVTPTATKSGETQNYSNAKVVSVRYKTPFNMNKLVIKANVSENTISNDYTIEYLNSGGTWTEFTYSSYVSDGTYLSKAAVIFKQRSSNIATLTTSSAHGFIVGNSISISLDDTSFNPVSPATTVTVISVPTSTTFTYSNSGANVSSTSTTGYAGGSMPSFNSKGILTLYYEDNKLKEPAAIGWSTGLTYMNYNAPSPFTTYPSIDDAGTSFTGSQPISIYGLRVTFNTIDATGSVGSSTSADSKELHLVEISPRLCVELSQLVDSVNITKELSNDNSISPIGISTSNTGTVTFTNIQRIFFATLLKNLTGQNCKFYVSYETDFTTSSLSSKSAVVSLKARSAAIATITTSSPHGFIVGEIVTVTLNDTTFDKIATVVSVPTSTTFTYSNDGDVVASIESTGTVRSSYPVSLAASYRDAPQRMPGFVMTTNSWTADTDKSTATLYDSMKYLSTLKAPNFLIKNQTPNNIASYLLDSVGFTDYSYNELSTLKVSALKSSISPTIKMFWTDSSKTILETLQSLFLPYQIAMYVDEFGALRFKSLDTIKALSLASTDLDINSSQIFSYSQTKDYSPKNLTLKYSVPKYAEVTNAGQAASGYRNIISDIWSPPADSIIGYLQLKNDIAENSDTLEYIYNAYTSAIASASGYLLVDEEIIEFDGRLYEFKIHYLDSSTQKVVSIKKIIKSNSDINTYISELYIDSNYNSDTKQVQNIEVKDLNLLCNLKRGMFGTKAKQHFASGSTNNIIAKDYSGTNTNIIVPINIESYNQNGVRIPVDLLYSNHPEYKTYAFLSDATDEKTLVYSASFTPRSYMDTELDLNFKNAIRSKTVENYSNGIFTYGIIINSDTTGANFAEGLCVEFQIDYTNKINKIDQRISIYDSATPGTKWTQLIGRSNSTADAAFNQYLNTETENNVVVILKTGIANLVDSMVLLINGKSFQFGQNTDYSDKNKITDFSFTANNSTKSIKLNGIDLSSMAIILESNKFFGVYTNRYQNMNINNLSTMKILNYSPILPTKEFVNIISDIDQNGLLGTKNKIYADAVLNKKFVSSNKNILINSYSGAGVAREIIPYNITYSSSPIDSPQLVKNDINTIKIMTKDEFLEQIPSIAVTSSDIIADNYQASFAVINSWDSFVPLNGTQGQTSIIKLKGKVVSPDNKQDISIEFDGRSGNQDAVLDTSWVQSEEDGYTILRSMASMAKMKDLSLDMSIRFNPAIQLCDIINVTIKDNNGDASKDIEPGKKIATKISHTIGLNEGKTDITLRGIPNL